jgi:hypothetical protein
MKHEALEAARQERLHPLLAIAEVERADAYGVRHDDDGADL